MEKYIHPDPEASKAFFQGYQDKGKVVMLNLLKFKAIADYSKLESIQPARELSGLEAYQLYTKSVFPALQQAGGRVLYFGQSSTFLIGPAAEQWDAVVLVEYESVSHFMAFAQSEAYQKYAGHRTAALDDSRLLPSVGVGS